MSARRLNIHACFGRLDGERSEHLAVGADHRNGHADDTDEILLPVKRNLLLANLTQLGVKPRAVGDGVIGISPQLQTLQ